MGLQYQLHGDGDIMGPIDMAVVFGGVQLAFSVGVAWYLLRFLTNHLTHKLDRIIELLSDMNKKGPQ